MISHRQRLENCLSGNPNDRIPVALWRHFPVDDQSPSRLAKATLAFQVAHDFDLIKVTPASSFCLKDWGAEDDWSGESEGTRKYRRPIIKEPEDWEKLPVLDPRRGFLADQLSCLNYICQEVGTDTPILQTIFNPLSQAKNLVGGKELLVHLRRYPEALHAGLKTITESTIRFIEAFQGLELAGVFFAVQHAQYNLLSPEEYNTFGRAYDLRILEATRRFWLNMLHLHGSDVMFERLIDYPVQIINWHDRETPPNLADGKELFPGAVCGGLRRETLVLGTPDEIHAEAIEAAQMTKGERFILGTGCVVPITAPFGNLVAARQSLGV